MPDFNIKMKLTPKKGGQTFEVSNVTDYSWRVSRQPGANGHVGMRRHDIDYIHFSRIVSVPQDGVAELDNGTVKALGSIDQKAYYSGEITLAQPDDEANVLQTLRWDTGHLCEVSQQASANGLQESGAICVTKLKVDDTEFKRNEAA